MLIKPFIVALLTLSGLCHAADGLGLAKVDLQEATRKILSDTKNRVLGATTVIIDGREVHVIKVLRPDGRIRHYKIDAETGAVIG